MSLPAARAQSENSSSGKTVAGDQSLTARCCGCLASIPAGTRTGASAAR